MEVIAKGADRSLLLELRGELDHRGAQEAILRMNQACDVALPLRLTLDFSGVTFMDSSGIALVMHARRRAHAFGGSLTLRRVQPQAARVLDAAGISRLVQMEREVKR